MRCSVCSEERRRIRATQSTVCPYRFFSCDACTGYEPRWLLVLLGRTEGIDSIKSLVAGRKYRGEEITMVELVG